MLHSLIYKHVHLKSSSKSCGRLGFSPCLREAIPESWGRAGKGSEARLLSPMALIHTWDAKAWLRRLSRAEVLAVEDIVELCHWSGCVPVKELCGWCVPSQVASEGLSRQVWSGLSSLSLSLFFLLCFAQVEDRAVKFPTWQTPQTTVAVI